MASLKREIGFAALLLISINAVMGTGLFFQPAIAARIAGLASLFSWIFIGIVALLMAHYLACLAGMFPRAGGIYEYVKQAFSQREAFLAGWSAWIVANITIAMLIVGSLMYVMPNASQLVRLLTAFSFVALFSVVSYFGIRQSTKLMLFFGIITLTAIFFVVVINLPSVDFSQVRNIFSTSFSRIFLAMFFIVESFFGWETLTFLAEEIKGSRKNLPRALMISTVIVVLIAWLYVASTLLSINLETFSLQNAPVNFVVAQRLGARIAKLFSFFLFIPLVGTAASWIVSSPRLLLAMARDNLFVPGLEKIHPKYKTPYRAILFQAIASCLIIALGFANYVLILQLLLPLALFTYSFALLALLKIRLARNRKFDKIRKAAGPSFLIIFFFTVIVFWLFYENSWSIFALSTVLILLGYPAYTVVKLQDFRFRERFFERISFVYPVLSKIFYSKADVGMMIENASIKSSDVVLDYGFAGLNIDELSKKLSKGMLVIADVSMRRIAEAIRIAEKKKLENVFFIKEDKLLELDNAFDCILSIGILSYYRNPGEILEFFRKIAKKGARISLIDFGRSFIWPAPPQLSSREKLRRLLKKASFSEIKIFEKNKFFTHYYFVSAVVK